MDSSRNRKFKPTNFIVDIVKNFKKPGSKNCHHTHTKFCRSHLSNLPILYNSTATQPIPRYQKKTINCLTTFHVENIPSIPRFKKDCLKIKRGNIRNKTTVKSKINNSYLKVKKNHNYLCRGYKGCQLNLKHSFDKNI